MVSKTIVVHTPNGLQLRPAGELAEYALRFRSSIMLSSGDKEISAKSLLGVLSLGIRQNTEIRITCAPAFATPEAMVPTPASLQSFTLIRARRFAFFRS